MRELQGKAAVGSGHRGSAVEGADSEEWRTADPYRFLPDPAANTGVHEEVHFADGHVERYSNTREQLAAHLSATGGKVSPFAGRRRRKRRPCRARSNAAGVAASR